LIDFYAEEHYLFSAKPGQGSIMKNLEIKATVTFPDGGKHYQIFGWEGLSGADAWFNAKMVEAYHKAVDLAKQFPGDLTATLTGTADGSPLPLAPAPIPKFSKKALHKFERYALKVQEELITISEGQLEKHGK
jgi:hypothetical protein